MSDDTPHITSCTAHLDSPFRLSGNLPAIEFSGVLTSEGFEVKADGADLPPYRTEYDYCRSTNDYCWGPQDDDDSHEVVPACANLARSILFYALKDGASVEKEAQKNLPAWHHTLNIDFMVQFYQIDLTIELKGLPCDKFLLTDKDIQTFICHCLLWPEILHRPYCDEKGKELEKKLCGQNLLKDPMLHLITVWSIVAAIGLGLLGLLFFWLR